MATGIINKPLAEKLILRRYTPSFGGAIAGGSTKSWTASQASYSVPTGYYPVGVSYFGTGSQYVSLAGLNLQNSASGTFCAVKNATGTSASSTGKVIIDVLFAPEWMVELISADEPAKPKSDIQAEPVFKIANFTCAYSSLAKNVGKSFTRDDMGYFVPDGYEVFSIRNISSGNNNVNISNCDPSSSTRMVTIRNTYTASLSGTVSMGVVFINQKYKKPDPRKGLVIHCNEPAGTIRPYQGLYRIFNNRTHEGYQVNDGGRYFPNTKLIPNDELEFRAYYYDTSQELYVAVHPTKVRIISGEEYIEFIDSTCYKFIITEDWTDRQIILEFTCD